MIFAKILHSRGITLFPNTEAKCWWGVSREGDPATQAKSYHNVNVLVIWHKQIILDGLKALPCAALSLELRRWFLCSQNMASALYWATLDASILSIMVVLESASSVFSPLSPSETKEPGFTGWDILCEQVKHDPSPQEEPVNPTQTCLPSLSNPWPQPATRNQPRSHLDLRLVLYLCMVWYSLNWLCGSYYFCIWLIVCTVFAVALLWKLTGSPDNQLECRSPPLFMPPTHYRVVQAVTQPLAVCQALCKHCAGDIFLFTSHNSPQEVITVGYI